MQAKTFTALTFVAAGAASASSVYTTVSGSAGPSHAELIASVIGGPFGIGSLESLRVADELEGGGVMSLLASSAADDRAWAGGVEVTVTTVVTGEDDVIFGIEQLFDGPLSPAPYAPLDLLSSADGVGESVTLTPGFDRFGWVLHNQTTRQTLRADGVEKDAFVTYDLSGLVAGADRAFLVLFDERLVGAEGFDGDYNDFGVLITTVPAPATAALLGLGALVRRKR